MSRITKTTRDLGDLIELVVKAMFGIVIVYLIAKALLESVAGPEAAKILSAVLGIAILFSVVVSKRVRAELSAFGKGK
jgi:hypothetical protein